MKNKNPNMLNNPNVTNDTNDTNDKNDPYKIDETDIQLLAAALSANWMFANLSKECNEPFNLHDLSDDKIKKLLDRYNWFKIQLRDKHESVAHFHQTDKPIYSTNMHI